MKEEKLVKLQKADTAKVIIYMTMFQIGHMAKINLSKFEL
jgi:hypothetical protein